MFQRVTIGKSKPKPKSQQKQPKPLNPKITKTATTNKQEHKKEEIFASCSFPSLGLQPALCDQLRDKMGFEGPTQVQAQTIPVVLAGRHVLVKAATGTGKTIAYLAPIIHHLLMYEPRVERASGTYALVLVPTRELCMQVYEILQKVLQRFHWIVPGYVMGGESRSKEKARLRKGISVLVASPGRLLDHIKNTTSFVHGNLRWIIFDEADRILELGYGKEIEEILDLLGSTKEGSVGKDKSLSKNSHSQRQNLLLSATLNEKVNHLANISLKDPVTIGIDEPRMSGELSKQSTQHSNLISSDMDDGLDIMGPLTKCSVADYNLPTQLIQRYVKVPCGSRLVTLLSILKSLIEMEASQKVVVFFSTCHAVDFHYSLFSDFLWQSDSKTEVLQKKTFIKSKTFRLHGNMEHEGRKTTFQGFKTEKSAILLCTDVAARGLDFPNVTCIIQYDSPGEASEYVHRVGRTARMGENGEALLFLQPVEMDYLQDLQKHGVTLKEYPLIKVLDSFPLREQKHHVKKFISVEMHPWVLNLQKALESFISVKPELKQLATEAFCSWVRAYTAHRGDLKRIFMVKKLHLGHVAKSFGLKDQPSLVGGSYQVQFKKRKKEQKQRGQTKKRKIARKT